MKELNVKLSPNRNVNVVSEKGLYESTSKFNYEPSKINLNNVYFL